MELRRTANAGVLLKLDGILILMDGVCREVKPYPATSPEERARLMKPWPDIVAFTHAHKDHYDPAYAAAYREQTGRAILGPGEVKGSTEPVSVGNVTVMPITSRHIGAAGKTVEHVSFIVRGTQCVWFLGDAAPGQWRERPDLPGPDLLIVPYAYVNTPASWQLTRNLGAKQIVLLHMPTREQDTLGLWNAVETTAGNAPQLYIPAMGQTLKF